MSGYVHGYSPRENRRLRDQAIALGDLLHNDSIFQPHSRILEAGCGIGVQTLAIASRNPTCEIVSVDVSAESVARARETVRDAGIHNVVFQQADIHHLAFPPGSFDHVFVCFVLEHLRAPDAALQALKEVLRPGGSIMLIEGDHGSAFFHPDSVEARRAIECLVEVQSRLGGNALIGRQLYPMLVAAGFEDVRVSPRFVYADASLPEMVEGFTRNTFAAMVEGLGDAAVRAGLMDAADWEKGIRDLHGAAEPDGVFCYTFFKATATKPGSGGATK
jgi:ubiquinone/menaquinone biosynthesis C-methylase UbiE